MLTDEYIEQFALNHYKSYSKYQTQHFVIDQALTPYKKVRQILLELQSRLKVKEEIIIAIKDLQAHNDLYQYEIDQETVEPKKEINRLKIETNNNNIRDNKVKLKATIEDIDMLNNMLRDSVNNEQTLDYMSKHDESEEQAYWKTRMTKQASLDILTTGRIGAGNLDSILNMNPNDQLDVVTQAISYTNKMNNTLASLEHNAIESNKLVHDTNKLPTLESSHENIQSTVKSQVKPESV